MFGKTNPHAFVFRLQPGFRASLRQPCLFGMPFTTFIRLRNGPTSLTLMRVKEAAPPREVGSRVRRLSEPASDPLVPTIFHETWWLDAASAGQWREVTVSSGGSLVGRLPFTLGERLGTRFCVAPRLTHFLGPAIDEGNGGAVSRNLRRTRIARELIQALPRTDAFYQRFHGGINETLAFQEAGFQTGVLFTFEVHPAPDGTLWHAMRDKTRNVIRRAQERVETVRCTSAEQFIAFYEANLAQRGRRNHYDPGIFVQVCRAALQRNRGCILCANGPDGEPLAAIFYVWDETVAYYTLSTRRQDADNGAVALLVWEAIRDAATRNLIFDMDGSYTAGSSLFYTGFGGQIRPRYIVSRSSFPYDLARRLMAPFGSRRRLY